MQHDEKILPAMLRAIYDGSELVIGTRYAIGGSVAGWNKTRLAMSRAATCVSAIVCKRRVSDPMSGFFMLRRELFMQICGGLSGLGFKILVDILSSAPRTTRVAEIPYTFRDRHTGVSKLDSVVLWEYGMLLADKLIGRFIPVRLISFGLVGSFGVLTHLATVYIALHIAGLAFQPAQIIATAIAMISNFALNNLLTYRDRRLKGARWFVGLLVFCAVCSIGAVANVGVAGFLFGRDTGWIVSALAGIAVGTVWNFAASNTFAWRRRDK
jgi:dolichol-phosphate mannosyltransferase